MPIKYSITFQSVTPESAEFGDFSDRGYIVKDAIANTFKELIDIWYDYWFIEPSTYPVDVNDPHIWLSSDYSTVDYSMGEDRAYNLHVDNKNALRHLLYYLKRKQLIN